MSFMNGEFCDTNVVVYAYDATAGAKREQAVLLLERLWHSRNGIVSIQVLQELFVSLTRRVSPRMPVDRARSVVADMATWHVVEPARGDVLEAIDASKRWQISFWDAMVFTTAKKAGATVLWSEDLNDGQSYDGTVVRNPFRAEATGSDD